MLPKDGVELEINTYPELEHEYEQDTWGKSVTYRSLVWPVQIPNRMFLVLVSVRRSTNSTRSWLKAFATLHNANLYL